MIGYDGDKATRSSFLDELLEIGDEVVCVHRRHLKIGIITDIIKFEEGFTYKPRIRVNNYKTLLHSNDMVKYYKPSKEKNN